MDIASLLPLLMAQKGNKNNDMMTTLIGEMMKNNGGAAPHTAAQSSGSPQDELLKTLLKNNGGKGGKGDMAAMLAQMLGRGSTQNKKPEQSGAGFMPILGIANNEIIGKLTKHYAQR